MAYSPRRRNSAMPPSVTRWEVYDHITCQLEPYRVRRIIVKITSEVLGVNLPPSYESRNIKPRWA